AILSRILCELMRSLTSSPLPITTSASKSDRFSKERYSYEFWFPRPTLGNIKPQPANCCSGSWHLSRLWSLGGGDGWTVIVEPPAPASSGHDCLCRLPCA